MWWEGGYVIHNTVNYPYIFRCLPKMFRFRCFSFRSVDLIVLLSFWEFFATYFLVFWRKSKKVNYKKKFILRRVTRRGEGGEVSRRKKKHFFSLRGFSFLWCRWNVYRRVLIPRKLPCPEKFLLTRLILQVFNAMIMPIYLNMSFGEQNIIWVFSNISVSTF